MDAWSKIVPGEVPGERLSPVEERKKFRVKQEKGKVLAIYCKFHMTMAIFKFALK